MEFLEVIARLMERASWRIIGLYVTAVVILIAFYISMNAAKQFASSISG